MTEVAVRRPSPPPLDLTTGRCPLCGHVPYRTASCSRACFACKILWNLDGTDPAWRYPEAPRCADRHPEWELYRCVLHEKHEFDHVGLSDAAVPHMLVPRYRAWPQQVA